MQATFPESTYAGVDMGDEEKYGPLDWAKLIAQIVGILTICGLLISIATNISGYRYEVAGLAREVKGYNETLEKVLRIYQRNEDAGRAAIQSQIDRLEMELTPYTPRQRRQKTEEQIKALKERLKVSKENGGEMARPGYGEPVSQR